MTFSKIFLVCILVMIPLLAKADEQSFFDTLDDLPLTLSETNLPNNPKRTFNSVYVIDRKMIDASGARTIGDVLKLVPGMVVGYRFGHWLSIGYHANTEQTMRRINMVVDGRSIYTPTSGGFVSFNTPVQVEDMERIEVYRGPAHADFGANSSGITIKIFTANAAEKQGTAVTGRVGTNSIRDGYVQHGTTLGDMALTMSLYQAEDGGVKNSEDSRRNRQLFMRGDMQLGKSDEITFSMGYGGGELDYWQNAEFTSPNHDGNDRSWFALTTWRHAWEDGSDLTVDASYTSMTRNTYYLTGHKPGIGRVFYEPNIAYERYGIDTKYSKALTEAVKISVGTQFKEDTVESENYFLKPVYKVLDFSGFGKIEWEFMPTWAMSFGVMRNYAETSHSSIDAFSYNIVKDVNFNNSIRIGYNEGVRQPLVYEQYAGRKQYLVDKNNLPVYEIGKTIDVNPEKNVTYDLSWIHQNDQYDVSSELRFFLDKYKKLIVHAQADNPGYTSVFGNKIVSPQNIDNPGSSKGVEYSIKWNPDDQLMIVASASAQDIDSEADIVNLYSGSGEAGPERVAALLMQYKFNNDWSVGATFNHVTSYNWTRSDEIPEQNNIDVIVSKCMNVNGEICIDFAVDNLLGDDQDFSPDVMTKRSAWSAVRLKF